MKEDLRGKNLKDRRLWIVLRHGLTLQNVQLRQGWNRDPWFAKKDKYTGQGCFVFGTFRKLLKYVESPDDMVARVRVAYNEQVCWFKRHRWVARRIFLSDAQAIRDMPVDEMYMLLSGMFVRYNPEKLLRCQLRLVEINTLNYRFLRDPLPDTSFAYAVKHHESLKHIDVQTDETVMVATAMYVNNFKSARDPSERACLFAVNWYPPFFAEIKRLTPAVCWQHVRNNPNNIAEVPAELQSAELCRHAVSRDPSALRHVCQSQRTLELCQYAWSLNSNYDGEWSCYVPEDVWPLIDKTQPRQNVVYRKDEYDPYSWQNQ